MSRRIRPDSNAWAAVLLSLLFLSCGSGTDGSLPKELLFSLQIGRMEDQIDIMRLHGIPEIDKNRIIMRDGLFYIANGNSNKVMEFTSYGDILSLYYDPDENPRPVLLSVPERSEKVTNRRAHPYRFNEIGEIAVTSGRNLMIEDSMPESRWEYDDDLGGMLSRIVLKFNRNGEFIDYLGQEGSGGTPFPYIDFLYVNSSDETIVICRTLKKWIVYWYSPEGDHLHTIKIPLDGLPVPLNGQKFPSLETVRPDSAGKFLYLKIDYYKDNTQVSGTTMKNVSFDGSRVWILDVNTGDYIENLPLPSKVSRELSPLLYTANETQVLYSFLGTAREGNLFFLAPDGDGRFEFLIMNRSGAVMERKLIYLDDREIFFRYFTIGPDGILSALIAREFEVDIVWWRSDRLLERRYADR